MMGSAVYGSYFVVWARVVMRVVMVMMMRKGVCSIKVRVVVVSLVRCVLSAMFALMVIVRIVARVVSSVIGSSIATWWVAVFLSICVGMRQLVSPSRQYVVELIRIVVYATVRV